ncbi:MAG: FAD-dependent oxidoreductase [Elusimicrobia bacterium]|nr:FAD-dependent oxidoreductase [Elusimicrobiota bacterium]
MKYSAQVLIIGGGPAAAVSAATAKKYYPDKEITVIKDVETSVVPCGIPYMISSLDSPEKNIMPFDPLKNAGVKIVIDKAVEIERDGKKVITAAKDEYSYEKLILALGSTPVVPGINGVELENVYSVKKDFDYLKKMIESVKKSKNIAVIGGGFIGVEFCDEISSLDGKNICLIEMLPDIIGNSFDKEFAEIAKKKLLDKGVKVLTGVRVEEISGKGKAEKIKLSDGQVIPADTVILSIGGIPNTGLAVKSGLRLGMGKGIWVDEYTRTIDTDIFAVGDCAGKRDFFTRKDNPVMLASVATAEARIAGANLYKLKVIRENKGTIAAYSTYLSGLVLASAGLTEETALRENFEVVVGKSESPDKHPGAMPGAGKLMIKLVFARQSGILIGGQVAGGNSVGEIINVIGLAIQKNVSMNELESFQMATHPYLTPPPTKYHIVEAAMNAIGK